jgi:hypothetical protein
VRDFCVFSAACDECQTCVFCVSRLDLFDLLVCCEHIMSGRVVEGVVLSVSLVCALHAVGSDSEHVFCASRELL